MNDVHVEVLLSKNRLSRPLMNDFCSAWMNLAR